MERADAEAIVATLRRANDLVANSVGQVKALSPETPFLSYRSLAGNIMASLFDIVDPLWRQWPELEPDIMKEPGGYDPARFRITPEAAEAILATMRQLETHLLAVETRLRGLPSAPQVQSALESLAEVRRLQARARHQATRDQPSRE